MLNIFFLTATNSLVSLLIWIVVIGAIIYCVRLLPIAEVFKQIALVVGVVIIFILAIKVLLPLAGI